MTQGVSPREQVEGSLKELSRVIKGLRKLHKEEANMKNLMLCQSSLSYIGLLVPVLQALLRKEALEPLKPERSNEKATGRKSGGRGRQR